MTSRRLPDEAHIVRLFPSGVRARVVGSEGDIPPLMAGEEALVGRAVASRQAEFARGRACARGALEALGCAAQPILAHPSRAPVWPAGFTGSITHCAGLVAAVAGATPLFAALGLDAEPWADLEPDLTSRLAHSGELAVLRERAGLAAERAARLVFSAKECVHKCVEPLTGQTLDFLDVALDFEVDRSEGGPQGAFRARAAAPAAEGLGTLMDLDGRFSIVDGFVLTAAAVTRP